MTRQQIFFHGFVQGVGFRYTVKRLSADFQVYGFVRNLPSGQVELVVEGARNELQRFVEAIQTAMEGHIRHVDVHTTEPKGEFDGFEIR